VDPKISDGGKTLVLARLTKKDVNWRCWSLRGPPEKRKERKEIHLWSNRGPPKRDRDAIAGATNGSNTQPNDQLISSTTTESSNEAGSDISLLEFSTPNPSQGKETNKQTVDRN
jgi:hypothetical protein